jgi:hypothetical protein
MRQEMDLFSWTLGNPFVSAIKRDVELLVLEIATAFSCCRHI